MPTKTSDEQRVSDEPRLFLSDDDIWCDRTRPLPENIYGPNWFDECDPAQVCTELEQSLRNARTKNERLESEVERLKTGNLYNGHRTKYQSAGMVPQLAGWYACHVDDVDHRECSGPWDSEKEAIEMAEKREVKRRALDGEEAGE